MLLVLVGVNVYVLFFGSGNLKKVRDAAREAAAETGAAIPAPPPAPAPAQKRTVTGKVRDGEGLGSVLRREKLRPEDSDAALRALGPVMDFKKEIKAGQKYVLELDDAGRLLRLELRASRETSFVVSRDAGGNLVARGDRPTQH
ncbi:MAG TPA: hypothetical protein VKE22_03105 [Haliangiales bacterium]|nr:hypothetical protein [Haliangiales bacterium]